MRHVHGALTTVKVVAVYVAFACSGKDDPSRSSLDAAGDSARGGASSAGSTSAGSGPFVPTVPPLCTEAPCGPGSICRATFVDRRCDPASARCVPLGDCNAENMPVCGCDHQLYANTCDAFGLGMDVLSENGDKVSGETCDGPDAGYVPCDGYFCRATTHACLKTPENASFAYAGGCQPLPERCVSDRSCACLVDQLMPAEHCFGWGCTEQPADDGEIGLTLTCLSEAP